MDPPPCTSNQHLPYVIPKTTSEQAQPPSSTTTTIISRPPLHANCLLRLRCFERGDLGPRRPTESRETRDSDISPSCPRTCRPWAAIMPFNTRWVYRSIPSWPTARPIGLNTVHQCLFSTDKLQRDSASGPRRPYRLLPEQRRLTLLLAQPPRPRLPPWNPPSRNGRRHGLRLVQTDQGHPRGQVRPRSPLPLCLVLLRLRSLEPLTNPPSNKELTTVPASSPVRRCGRASTSFLSSRPRRTATRSADGTPTRRARRSCWARTRVCTTRTGRTDWTACCRGPFANEAQVCPTYVRCCAGEDEIGGRPGRDRRLGGTGKKKSHTGHEAVEEGATRSETVLHCVGIRSEPCTYGSTENGHRSNYGVVCSWGVFTSPWGCRISRS